MDCRAAIFAPPQATYGDPTLAGDNELITKSWREKYVRATLHGRRLSLYAACFSVFGWGQGRAGLCNRAGAVCPAAAIGRGVRRDRGLSCQARSAADRVLRLRIALAEAIHRARVYRFQSPLCAAAVEVADLPRR